MSGYGKMIVLFGLVIGSVCKTFPASGTMIKTDMHSAGPENTVIALFAVSDARGCAPLTVTIQNQSVGATGYQWNFGDGNLSATQASSFTHTWQNTTDAPVEYTLHLTAFSSQNSDVKTVTITVYPEVKTTITASATEGCAPFTPELDHISENAANYQWDFGDGNISFDPSPDHTFQNSTDQLVIYPVTLTAHSISYNGITCSATSDIKIDVKPSPSASFAHSPASGCSPLSLEITNLSEGSIIANTWDFGDGNPTFENNQPVFSHQLVNNSMQDRVFTIGLTVENSFGCFQEQSVSATVHGRPSIAFEASDTLSCDGLMVSFTNNSEGAVAWSWNFGNGIVSNETHPAGIPFSNPNPNLTRVFQVTLTGTTQKGCQASSSRTIEILPAPVAGFSLGSVSVCATNDKASIILNNESLFALSVSWKITNTTTGEIIEFENNNSIVNLEVTNTTGQQEEYIAEQTVINNFFCSSTVSRTFTVDPSVRAVPGPVEDGCHPHNVTFTSNSPGAVAWLWEFNDGSTSALESPQKVFNNFSHTEPAEFSARLTVTSEAGCSHDTIIFFKVFPRPLAAFSLPQQQFCAPFDVLITDQSIVSGNLPYTWQSTLMQETQAVAGNINYVHGTVTSEPVNDTIRLSLINEFGCTHTFASTIKIFPEVVADFSLDVANGCHPLEVVFTNLSEGADALLPYFWDYGNGSSYSQQPEHSRIFSNISHTEPMDYAITLRATSQYGCRDSITRSITVFPRPMALYELSESEVCSPTEVNFTDLSLGSDLSFTWQIGNEFTDNTVGNTSYTFSTISENQPETFSASLTITNSYECSQSFSLPVTVFPAITARFGDIEAGCHPLTAKLENLSTGAIRYIWELGDGQQSFLENPAHTFTNPSADIVREVNVQLTALSQWGCAHTFSGVVEVFPDPGVSFITGNIVEGCSPLEITFTNTTQGAASFNWSINDEIFAPQATTFVRSFINAGAVPDTLKLMLSGQNSFGCAGKIERPLVVYPEVTAAFSSENEIYAGCSPLKVAFVNQSEKAGSYLWLVDNDAISDALNPEYTFIAKDNEESVWGVTLRATSVYGCSAEAFCSFTVFPQPVVDFEALPFEQFFPETTIFVNNYSSTGNWIFDWEMGDGTTIRTTETVPFQHTYQWPEGANTTQAYRISLRASSQHCSDSMFQQVRIISDAPVADFSSDTIGCPPFRVEFENLSYFADTWFWDFGDGSTSTEQNPDHIYTIPGTYTVALSVTGETGTSQTTSTIRVIQPPVANFRVVPDEVILPDGRIQITNLTSMAASYLWDFGDGNTSTEPSPFHEYTQPGIYTITLTASGNSTPQCIDQAAKPIAVLPSSNIPQCYMYFPNAFTPNPSGGNGGSYISGDPANHVFHPRHNDIEDFSLEIFNRWGEKIFESNDISIGWDGYVKGSLAPMGVYIYQAKGICVSGREIESKGDITLLR